ncbi:exodeoxyribonuclease VII small subunit [Chloroflexota bacterium]|nr:exodeoxyribonuclease VII small subunit [Chloroflexota bacterium]
MPDKVQTEIQKMDFEAAFTALQENVTLLEGEELPLEKALEVYERGQLLARHCAELLETAEIKLRQLSQDAASQAPSEG